MTDSDKDNITNEETTNVEDAATVLLLKQAKISLPRLQMMLSLRKAVKRQ